MRQGDIYGALDELFRDMFDDDGITLTPETTADDIEDWDSLAHINLLVAIEARFGIKFRTAEVESMHNVAHLVAAIEQKTERR